MSTCPIVCAPNTWLSQLGSTWRPIHMNRDIPFSVSNKCTLTNKKKLAWIVRDILCHFPELGTGFVFSRAWYRIFTRLARVLCFTALGREFFVRFSTGFMFGEREIKPFPLWKWIKSRFGEREVLTQQVHTSLWHSIGWTSNNLRKICRLHVQVVLKDTKKGRKQLKTLY